MPRLICLSLLILAACGSAKLKPGASVGARTWVPLSNLAPEPGLAAVQHFHIENRGRSLGFNGFAEIEPGRWAIVGLTPLDSRAFSVTWENDQLNFEHLPFYRLPVKPGVLMAAYQMIFLSEASLRTHLADNGLSLETQPGLRRIYRGRTEVVRIEYSEASPFKGEALLQNLRRGHKITISTRQIEPF